MLARIAGVPDMMSLPFFAAALAVALGWGGWPRGAAAVLVLAVALTLGLFALHATDPLAIDL